MAIVLSLALPIVKALHSEDDKRPVVQMIHARSVVRARALHEINKLDYECAKDPCHLPFPEKEAKFQLPRMAG